MKVQYTTPERFRLNTILDAPLFEAVAEYLTLEHDEFQTMLQHLHEADLFAAAAYPESNYAYLEAV